MKKLLIPVIFLFTASQLCAQKFSPADLKKIKSKEDSLRTWAYYMITDSFTEDRLYSDSIFTKTFVRALQVKNSFYDQALRVHDPFVHFAAVSIEVFN